MPQFMFDAPPIDDEARLGIHRITRERFPEIAVTRRFTTHDPASGHDVWVCHAPNAAHLARWAIETGVELHDLRQIHEDPPPSDRGAPE